MSRDVNEDFIELKTFVKNYNLLDTNANLIFEKLLSIQHKRYFAVLTLLSELKHQNIQAVAPSVSDYESMNKSFFDYTAESVSDLGSALFVWIHGAYKAARQVLRSSIENFMKGVGSTHSNEIVNLKNTYEVIDLAGELAFFKNSNNEYLFKFLKDNYANLCADVHTATIQNMMHISALGYFPNFNEKEAISFQKIFLRVSEVYASILSLLFKESYKKIHYKNRDIIANILPPNVLRTLSS
jgi:hypothetical protein